jgi:hypothetical protein
MSEEQFKLLYDKIEKLDERVFDYNKIVNNDIKHMAADMSAIKVAQEDCQRKIDALCGEDKELRKGLASNDLISNTTSSYVKLIIQVLLPVLSLIVGMFIKSKF